MALDGVPPGPAHDAAAVVAGRLADLVGDVHAVCRTAQTAAPSEATEVPGGDDGRWLDTHRALSRAATLAAQAAESLTMARVELSGAPEDTDPAAALRHVDAAQRSVDAVAALVGDAERLSRPAATDG